METASPKQKKCLFGRRHNWMTRGTMINDRKVYLCTTCGLVNGTDKKVSLELGALYEAERVYSAHLEEAELGQTSKTITLSDKETEVLREALFDALFFRGGEDDPGDRDDYDTKKCESYEALESSIKEQLNG